MTKSSPFRFVHNQPVLLALGFAVLVMIGIATVWLVSGSREQTEEIVRALDVQNKISALLLNVRRAETSQRGFLLTGGPDHQSDFDEAVTSVPSTLADLKTAIAGNPEQQKTLGELEPVISKKLAEMEETFRLYRSNDAAGAFALVRGGEGRVYMETIRATLERLAAGERSLLQSRAQRVHDTGIALLIATFLGTALIVVLAGASLLLVRRSNRERDQAQASLQTAYDSLETIVDERTADLREANEEIQRFAYIVSHDLRSPLVNVMGFTSELEALKGDMLEKLAALRADDTEGLEADKAIAGDFDEALGFIKASISKMDRLINAILKLSREGRREFRPELIDMTGMLGAIGDTLAHQATEVGAELIVGELPPVTSDRLALEQVFSNLVDNALKYLRSDEPGRIEISGRSTPKHVAYDVSDNGRGIDPKDHQRVFELFRRAGAQDRPGEGIGLAHVRALVRRLGGTMDVKSELGRGSVFTVTLPRRWVPRMEKEAA